MEENLNQVVPSASYDWLEQCGRDDDRGNNQVVPVPVSVPASSSSLRSVESFSTTPQNEHVLRSPNAVADSDLLLLPGVEKYSQKAVRMLAVEESLKALTLEGVQVVPSASKSPTMETIATSVDLRTSTSSSTSKFFRTSKTTVQNA